MSNFEDLKFTAKDIEKAALDARIKVTGEEVNAMTDELNNRLKRILELQQVNTENIEPLVNPLEPKYTLQMRKDEVTEGNLEKELMERAPKSKNNYYLVPGVMDNL